LSRADALVELDREVRLVTLWGLRAISGAWDTRRLGYGNEGAHPYEHEVAALVGNNAGFAPDHIAAACEILSEHEARLATDPAYPARCAVRGRTGAGGRTLLAALADHAGRALGVIDATRRPRDADRFVDALRVALRRAQLAGLVPVVHRLDAAIFDHRSGSDV